METQCFASSTKVIQSERRKAAFILEQHDKLLDILQIPQLIDACVRNGYYSEAMDLSAHTVTLLARFPKVPIIIDIAAEAEQAIRLMSTQLLNLLRKPAKLPVLFKAVNFLRRMGSLDEEELAVAFLTSREIYLEGAFGDIEKRQNDHQRYIRKYLDIFREGVYDIITQYTSIFLDRIYGEKQNTALHGSLLHFLQIYIHSRVMQLAHVLDTAIAQIDDPTVLTSLLTQLTYCATSFARVGLDFRSIIERPFTQSVLLNATKAFSSAAREFNSQMNKNAEKSVSKWFITPMFLASLSHTTIPDFDESSPVHVAPSVISSYPVLAIYTNSILTALNSLRLLAPISLYSQVSHALETSLAEVGRELCLRIKTRYDLKKGTEDNQAFVTAGSVYLKYLIPFATRALREGVYNVKGKIERGTELQDILSELESIIETLDIRKEESAKSTL
jgi:hypothetical protein